MLILRDVLGRRSNETAVLLESSVASVDSALQRVRCTQEGHLSQRRLDRAPATAPSAEKRAVSPRFIVASEAADMGEPAAHAQQTMPPEPIVFLFKAFHLPPAL